MDENQPSCFSRRSFSGVPCLVVKPWLEIGFVHGFFGREIDVSRSDRAWSHSFPGLRLGLLEQRHGTDVIVPDDLGRVQTADGLAALVADGWIAHVPALYSERIALGIKTADCHPVIIRDRYSRFAAVLHCGWRGAAGGILVKALQVLFGRGICAQEIELAIGPGAGPCCYEIGSDVAAVLWNACGESLELRDGATNRMSVVIERREKQFGDIAQLLRIQAQALGVADESIYLSGECTICSDKYFSWRREKALSGRQVSFIGGCLPMLKDAGISVT